MSKALDKYFIQRLEKTERDLKYEQRRSECILEDLKKAQNQLNVLADLFDITKSTDGERSCYKLKGSCLISEDEKAFEVIKELQNPPELIPF